MTGSTHRAQSSIDFVIGIGVFFLSLSFVIVLLPELLSPFSMQEGTMVADLAIGTLTVDHFASDQVGELDETCVAEFFAGSGTTCSFDASEPTTAITGIPEYYSLNVTLEHNSSSSPGTELACYNGTAVLDCSTGGDPLRRGDPPPADSRSVWTEREVVSVDGETLWLKLRVW